MSPLRLVARPPVPLGSSQRRLVNSTTGERRWLPTTERSWNVRTVAWRSRPVWILRRTRDALDTLSALDSRLADPHSLQPQQLPACQNEYRSIKPEYFVAVGICTHLGCVPTFRPDAAPSDLGPDWVGGFFCPCHGTRYDLAGRVFKNSPAPLNLPVPPYHYVTDALLRVGETAGGKEQQWQPATW